FSASETSIISLSKIRLRHMLSKGHKGAQHVQRLVNNLDKFIVAILVGNNFVNIAISAIVTAVFVDIFGHSWGVVFATFATAMFVLIFCEITPKILAIKHTEKTAQLAGPLMEIFIKLFHPLIAVFMGISNLILRILRIKAVKHSPLITEEELRMMIEAGREEGVVTDEERKMLHRIFEFGDTRVRDVMVPKEKMVAVNIALNPEELLDIFVEEGHARLPVYKDSLENIVGVIYARDLLYILKEKGLFVPLDLVHDVCKAQGAMRVNELLQKFQQEKIQLAIVVDEHKKTLGMVTLEDLIEEIVGEIEEDRRHRFKEKAKKI
ncbi:MAG: hemolysin family protein, partial [Candidatus Omnitrophota bacterium]|nr:hemolysin family protein [Candidatus Omnitrophota bacterium]